MNSFYDVGFIVGFCLTSLIGVVVLLADRRRPVNRAWASLSLLVAIWFIGRYLMLNAASIQAASFGQKIAFSGSIYLTVAYCHFVYRFLQRRTDWILIVGYVSTTLAFLANWFSPFFISHVAEVPVLRYYEIAGPLYIVHLLNYLAFPGFGFQLLLNRKRESPGSQTNQLNILLLASNIGFVCGLTTFPMNYGIHFPPIGAPFVSVYVLLIAYAILIHRLLDFNLVVRWGLAFAATMAALSLVYYLLTFLAEKILASVSAPRIPTLFALCLSVLIFDPLRQRISKLVDKFIFKSPDLNVLLEGLGDHTSYSNIEDLAPHLCERMKKIWGTSHAGIVLWDAAMAEFKTIPYREFAEQIVVKREKQIKRDDFLVRTLETERRLFKGGMVTEEELNYLVVGASPGERTTLFKMRRTLRWFGAAIAVPLMSFQELSGFLILGSKNGNSPYSNDDKKLLSHIANLIEEVIDSNRRENSQSAGLTEQIQ